MCKLISAFVAVALSLVATGATHAQEVKNDRFKQVMQQGVLRVGVQGAFKPWSFRAPDGKMQGIEIDLAQSIADQLGVKLEPVVIDSSNRIDFLKQGKVDLVIGGISDRPDRRKVVGLIEPGYWTSGANLMAKQGVIKSWDDIKGKPVCGKQGVFYNKLAEVKFGAKIVAFNGNTEAKEALRSGKCIAWIYDDASINADLVSGDWNGYELPVETVFSNPWAVAVPLEEKDGAWGAVIAGMAYNWHRSGKLVELEKKWGVRPSDWIKKMHEQLTYDDSYLEN